MLVLLAFKAEKQPASQECDNLLEKAGTGFSSEPPDLGISTLRMNFNF